MPTLRRRMVAELPNGMISALAAESLNCTSLIFARCALAILNDMATFREDRNGGGSSTVTIEMVPTGPVSSPEQAAQGSSKENVSPNDQALSLPAPTTAVEVLERWNNPRINVYRILATFYTFIILGANDAAFGALIPYLEEYYSISYTVVSLVFLSPCVGYIASAFTNNLVHMKLGQRGVAALGPGAHLVAYIVVVFMLRVRHGSPFASGLTSTGFWLGVTVGRIVLGFVTARVFRNEKQAIAAYLVVCMALELMFWLIPHFIVSAIMVSLLGFFVAPFFPAAVIAATKLLPKHLHVAGVGLAAALGATGACIFPFAIGAIASAKGVSVLQPIILAMLAVDLGIWLMIPTLPKVRSV
ncbi:MAG: hypothetical protein Q9227_006803 [Pyrenula ochraceoflavens]